METDDLIWGGDRLGVYFPEREGAQRGGQVIYDRAGSSLVTIEPGMVDWEMILAAADWFHWTGITPGVSASSATVCQEALSTSGRLGLTDLCDLHHGAQLQSWAKDPSELMPDLVRACDLHIGNACNPRQILVLGQRSYDG